MALTVLQPSRVTLMIKPVGALCNLDCTYCYYLPTKAVFDGHEHRMSLATLRNVLAGLLPDAQDQVMIAWQGGEPTLAGLDFFHKAVEYCQAYARPGQTIAHSLQTNGTLLTDDWCRFFARNQFLIGLSLDGPPEFHNHYRLTNNSKPSSDQVLAGMNLLQKHGVEYNILCVLNDRNVHYPDQILGYLLNLGVRWVQFIPAIEWIKAADPAQALGASGNQLAPYAPDPQAYGTFLCRVFDLWFEKYRKRVSVRFFDAVLNKLVLGVMPFCILDGSCHNQLTIEHDGAVFGCDHFVERRWQLGRIGDSLWSNPIQLDGSTSVGLTVHGTGMTKSADHAGRNIAGSSDLPAFVEPATDLADDPNWMDRLDSGRLSSFAQRKQHLPPKCVSCKWKPYCHGGCPKHRASGGDAPEPTILCPAYMQFYEHAMPRLQWLADYLRKNQQPPDPIGQPARLERRPTRDPATRPGSPNRNDPCPCGSGVKYKRCHGKNH